MAHSQPCDSGEFRRARGRASAGRSSANDRATGPD